MKDPALARREAADWIVRMHSAKRTEQVDAGFGEWLAQSPEHRRAFELANEIWDVSARLPKSALTRTSSPPLQPAKRPLVWLGAAAAAAAIALIAVGLWQWVGESGVKTAVGEQRILTLEDGTRVSLNTATRLRVDFDEKQRHVRLEAGEALFEVARQAGRPFVVSAGGRDILALGTSFVVRLDAKQVAVTLVEGKVSVASVEPVGVARAKAQLLEPGERVTFEGFRAPHTDRPSLSRLTAWRQGQVAFDETRLEEAVEELNRYSPIQLVVEQPQAKEARVSGVFRVGQSESFARAIAQTYRLELVQQGQRIELKGVPRFP